LTNRLIRRYILSVNVNVNDYELYYNKGISFGKRLSSSFRSSGSKEVSRMYTNDLRRVLELLEISTSSGVLVITPGSSSEQATWEAKCVLKDGWLINCTMRQHSDGKVLMSGSQALAWLKSQERLSWRVLEDEPLFVGKTRGGRSFRYPGPIGEIPRRTAQGQRYLISPSWPRIQRLIFALIDGRRSKTDIARLLSSKSIVEVEQTLHTLRLAGLVE